MDELDELAEKASKRLDELDEVAEAAGKRLDGVDKIDELEDVVEGGTDVPAAYRQAEFASSYDARINQTPSLSNKKVQFVGDRGESQCVLKPPPDPELEKLIIC